MQQQNNNTSAGGNTFTFGNQPQTFTEIDIDVHQKLVKAGIIKANAKAKINDQGKKITVDNETSLVIESGVAISRYLVAVKQSLTVTTTRFQ